MSEGSPGKLVEVGIGTNSIRIFQDHYCFIQSHIYLNPSPADPGYTLPLQTV